MSQEPSQEPSQDLQRGQKAKTAGAILLAILGGLVSVAALIALAALVFVGVVLFECSK